MHDLDIQFLELVTVHVNVPIESQYIACYLIVIIMFTPSVIISAGFLWCCHIFNRNRFSLLFLDYWSEITCICDPVVNLWLSYSVAVTFSPPATSTSHCSPQNTELLKDRQTVCRSSTKKAFSTS